MEDSSSRSRFVFDRFFRYLDRRRPSDRFIFVTILWIGALALVAAAFLWNNQYSKSFPSQGGTFIEGVIGTPRFVNPVLAVTRADYDLVELVYSGLLTLETDGMVREDLAESITISDDGTVYNVILRNNATFHDGETVDTEDVAYTIGLIQTAELKSPLRGNWNGVVVEVISEREINFVLEEPYVPFIENLTVGILPKHIWETLAIEELPFSQHNTVPIGSGPYKITEVGRDAAGLIDDYTLEAVSPDAANINTVTLNFYQNEVELLEAFEKGDVLASASLSNGAVANLDMDTYNVYEASLPRVFSVFINQNRTAALRDSAAREALSVAINREALITETLAGYGTPTNSPLPGQKNQETNTSRSGIEAAAAILEAADWERSANGRWVKQISEIETELAITITTANTPVFEQTAAYLERVWTELGVSVSVALFEQSDLVQAVIRPRDYQALLFGADIGRSADLYPFWHSSQRSDPGLNVALYANITTDALLEEVRITQDPVARAATLEQIASEITTEQPAIFLYNPSFVYVVKQSVENVSLTDINRPSERFTSIQDWYMQEEKLWPIFSD